MSPKLILRLYQDELVKLIGESFRRGNKRVIAWMATGGGKTASFIHITDKLVRGNKRVLIVMRRRDLIFQTAASIEKFTGLKCSIIMGNEKGFDPSLPIQVCSIDTISRRIDKVGYEFLFNYEYIQVDECHDTTSKSYVDFLEKFPDAYKVGWTATPFPTGNKYLIDWQDCVSSITAKQLRDQGYLTPERTYAPKKIDVSGIKTIAGEFDQKALAQRAMESKIVGDSVDIYLKLGENRAALGFAVNIEHSKLLAEAFRQRGIPAVHIDKSHNKEERALAISQLENGTIKILFSINVFSTGTDIPCVGCLVMARPTKSEILYVQQVGRGLRPYKKCAACGSGCGAEDTCFRCGSTHFTDHKIDCIILDQANNCERFGLAYDTRYARLRPETKKKKRTVLEDEVKTKTCEECYAVYSSDESQCPMCDHTNAKTKREIDQEEGELELKKSADLRYSRMIRIKNDLMKWSNPKWKKSAKWTKLHQKYGDEIFGFKKELEMGSWVRAAITRNKKGVSSSTKTL